MGGLRRERNVLYKGGVLGKFTRETEDRVNALEDVVDEGTGSEMVCLATSPGICSKIWLMKLSEITVET